MTFADAALGFSSCVCCVSGRSSVGCTPVAVGSSLSEDGGESVFLWSSGSTLMSSKMMSSPPDSLIAVRSTVGRWLTFFALSLISDWNSQSQTHKSILLVVSLTGVLAIISNSKPEYRLSTFFFPFVFSSTSYLPPSLCRPLPPHLSPPTSRASSRPWKLKSSLFHIKAAHSVRFFLANLRFLIKCYFTLGTFSAPSFFDAAMSNWAALLYLPAVFWRRTSRAWFVDPVTT